MTVYDNLLPFGGEVYYFPGVIDRQQADLYFNILLSEVRWKQEPIRLFGKEIMQPRLTAWYGDEGISYSYSGVTMTPNPWMAALQQIKRVADELAGSTSTSALLNLYRDGNDSMGWHRDNEKMLGKIPVIASVSLGTSRLFQLRDYATKKVVIPLELEHGSILIMRGESQQQWEHRVPKRSGTSGARINITFRNVQS